MPPTLADRLIHILTAIETVQSAVAGKSFDEFTNDLIVRLAVERSLEIICEASRRLPDNVKNQHPEIDWPGMVNFGNRARHEYHRINPNIVWDIIKEDLLPLKEFAERAMREEDET